METPTVLEREALRAPVIAGDLSGPRVSHAVLLAGTQVAKWSFRVLFVLVIARALGPAEFGVYALLYTMVEFLGVASGSGYIDYLTREAAKDARVGWGLAFQLVVLRVSVAVPAGLIEIGILRLLAYPRTVLVGTAFLSLTLIPRALSEAVQGVLRGLQRYKCYLAIEFVLGAVLVVGAGLLSVRHGGLHMAIGTEIVAAGVAGFLAVVFGLKYKTKEVIGLKTWQLVKRGGVFNLYSFVGSLYDKFDVVLLSRLAGGYATGIYSVAYRALGMTQILAYGVLFSLLPGLSRDAGGAVERQRMDKARNLLLSAAFAVVLTTMVFAGPAVKLFLGAAYADSTVALKILIWAVILRYINFALNTELLAAGREKVFVATTLVCLAVNFFGNLVFIPIYSWRAAGVVTIATEFALFIQDLYWVRKLRGSVPTSWTMGRNALVFVFLLALAMIGGYMGAPLAVGLICVALFAAYLYRVGISSEISTVWNVGRASAS